LILTLSINFSGLITQGCSSETHGVLLETKKRRTIELLEHCALNANESKLHPTNEDLALFS
jgi:hypothetical protein